MYQNCSDGSGRFLGNICLLIIAILLVIIAINIVKELPRFKDIPRTVHADTLTRDWKPERIQEYMDSGKCIPNFCVSGDTIIYYCEYEPQPKYSLILIVGKTIEQVITGYMTETTRVPKLCAR